MRNVKRVAVGKPRPGFSNYMKNIKNLESVAKRFSRDEWGLNLALMLIGRPPEGMEKGHPNPKL